MEILSKKIAKKINANMSKNTSINVFENAKTNTFNLYEIFNLLHSDLVF